MPEEPPKLAVWLARRLVGGRDGDAVVGDLKETFAYRGGGRLWFWGQALSCLAVRLSFHRRSLPSIGQGFHRALRRIRRNPGYALTAMLCLALAMGVNTVLFSFLDSLFYRELPVPGAGSMVVAKREAALLCTWPQFLALRDTLRSMDAAATLPASATFDIGRANLRVTMEVVSANYANVLRIGPARGAWFDPQHDTGAAEPAIVISHAFWTGKLHSDPDIVGRRVLLEDMPFRIIGVGPPGFTGVTPPIGADLFVPAGSLANSSDPRASRTRVNLIGRLRPGQTPATAAAELRVRNAALQAADPANTVYTDPIRVDSAAGFLWTAGRRGLTSTIAFGAVLCGVVLLIACVNVGNLLLSRATVRRRDLALQQALGAGRGRLFREVLAEGLLLAGGGVGAGLITGHWLAGLIAAALPSIPIASGVAIRLDIDWRIALALTAAGTLSAILFSLPPAMQGGKLDVIPALNGAGKPSRQREIYSLVQVALSLALLVIAALTACAMARAQSADLGFATDHRLSIMLFASPKNPAQPFTAVLEQTRQLPGVLAATLASGPLGPGPRGCASPSDTEPSRRMGIEIVDPSYFAAMRVALLEGRNFQASEPAQAVIVNETFARTWWPAGDALGKSVWLGCAAPTRKMAQVIGIARDTRNAFDQEARPAYYLSRLQEPGNGAFALVVHTAGPPRQWSNPVLDAVKTTAPGLRVYEAQTLEDAVAISTWEIRWQAALLAGLSILAMILAMVGLYGVVAFAVSQRTREIGVRMALGATRQDVQWMVLVHGLRIAIIGVVAGTLISAAAMPLLRHYLSGIGPLDLPPLAAATLLWIMVAMLASWYPARRATRVDPVTALRYE